MTGDKFVFLYFIDDPCNRRRTRSIEHGVRNDVVAYWDLLLLGGTLVLIVVEEVIRVAVNNHRLSLILMRWLLLCLFSLLFNFHHLFLSRGAWHLLKERRRILVFETILLNHLILLDLDLLGGE